MNHTPINQTCRSFVDKLTLEEILVYQFRAYITPLIILFGLCGNVLVLIVFASLHQRVPCRFNLYVIGITVAHNLELIFNAFLDDFMGRGLTWLSDCTIFIKLDTQSSFACKFFAYLPEVAPIIANTVLALFSCDRVVTVYQPIKYRGDQYLYVSITGIIVIYLIDCLVYLPSLIYTGLVESDQLRGLDRTTCRYLDPLNFAVQFTLYMSNIGSTIIPFAIVSVTTLLIVLKLKRLFAERTRMGGQEERGLSELRRVIGHLAMTTTFFVINLPILIVVLLRQHADYHDYQQRYPDYDYQIKNLSRLFSSVKSLNHAMEFPTFVLFLPTFRSELTKLCKSCWPHASKPIANKASSQRTNVQICAEAKGDPAMAAAATTTGNNSSSSSMKARKQRRFSQMPLDPKRSLPKTKSQPELVQMPMKCCTTLDNTSGLDQMPLIDELSRGLVHDESRD